MLRLRRRSRAWRGRTQELGGQFVDRRIGLPLPGCPGAAAVATATVAKDAPTEASFPASQAQAAVVAAHHALILVLIGRRFGRRPRDFRCEFLDREPRMLPHLPPLLEAWRARAAAQAGRPDPGPTLLDRPRDRPRPSARPWSDSSSDPLAPRGPLPSRPLSAKRSSCQGSRCLAGAQCHQTMDRCHRAILATHSGVGTKPCLSEVAVVTW